MPFIDKQMQDNFEILEAVVKIKRNCLNKRCNECVLRTNNKELYENVCMFQEAPPYQIDENKILKNIFHK